MIELGGSLYRVEDIVCVQRDKISGDRCRILIRGHGWFPVAESYETLAEELA